MEERLFTQEFELGIKNLAKEKYTKSIIYYCFKMGAQWRNLTAWSMLIRLNWLQHELNPQPPNP